jgi:hypothetical protein
MQIVKMVSNGFFWIKIRFGQLLEKVLKIERINMIFQMFVIFKMGCAAETLQTTLQAVMKIPNPRIFVLLKNIFPQKKHIL